MKIVISRKCKSEQDKPAMIEVFENDNGARFLRVLGKIKKLDKNENPEDAVHNSIIDITNCTDYQNLTRVQWGIINPNDLSNKARKHKLVYIMVDRGQVINYIHNWEQLPFIFTRKTAKLWIKKFKQTNCSYYLVPIEGKSGEKILSEDDIY